MCVIRVKHERNYVVLQKEVLENQNLSLKAKGLWAFCLSRPDDWQFHVSELALVLKEGKSALYSALKELVLEGYCIKEQKKGEDGRFNSFDYLILETKKLKESLPQTDFPHADNRTLLSNDNTKEKIVCPAAPVLRKVEKTSTKGEKLSISRDEVFRVSIQKRKDWLSPEIEEAWQILSSYEGRVNDWEAFIEGVIVNLRSKKKLKNMKQESEKCQKKTSQIQIASGRSSTKEDMQKMKGFDLFGIAPLIAEQDLRTPQCATLG